MNIFISWSGARAQQLALILREWLPTILQGAKPWVSSEDISAGTVWQKAIHDQLRDSKYAIICLTPENLASAWVLFEAGALFKGLDGTLVAPLVLGMTKNEVPRPLGALQCSDLTEVEVAKLCWNLAQAGELPVDEPRVKQLVGKFWAELQAGIDAIPEAEEAQVPARSLEDKVDEMLELLRDINLSRSATERGIDSAVGVVNLRARSTLSAGSRPTHLPTKRSMHIANEVAQVIAQHLLLTPRMFAYGPSEVTGLYDARFDVTEEVDLGIRDIVLRENVTVNLVAEDGDVPFTSWSPAS